MFDKQKANEKIDGMVALAMGLDRAMRHAAASSGLIVLGPKKEESEQKSKDDVEQIEDLPEKKKRLKLVLKVPKYSVRGKKRRPVHFSLTALSSVISVADPEIW